MKKTLPFIILFIIALVIAIATIVEDNYGTEIASKYIYSAPWFVCLWGAVVLFSVPLIVKRKLWKRIAVFGLHLSFITILAGALITHLFGEKNPTPFDGKGSFAYDPYGIAVSFTGYAMLAISAVWMLIARSGEIKNLIRKLKESSSVLSIIMLLSISLAIPSAAQAERAAEPHCMERAKADSLKTKQIIYNGRICPLNTLARDFTTKLTGKASFGNLTPEQVLLSWLLYADDWQHVNMIKVKDKNVKKQLGITTELACFADFFDQEGYYRLPPHAHPDVEDKLGIILWLQEGTLLLPLPAQATPLPDEKVRAEILYNETPFATILFILCLTTAFITLGFITARIAGSNLSPAIDKGISIVTTIVLITALIILTFCLALRWYISGTVPLTNGLETMQFIAFVSLLCGTIIAFTLPRANYIKAGTLLIAGFTLLVSHLAEMNPQITAIAPALMSPWLSSHVSIIMVSYAIYGFMFINSITYLIVPSVRTAKTAECNVDATPNEHPLTILNRLLLYPSTFCLAIGIFLGAVWASESWGAYWSWDPKESWALISMMLYGVAFHNKSLSFLRSEKIFHIYIIMCFLTIIMTYFGVNYLLGGMHSYANS